MGSAARQIQIATLGQRGDFAVGDRFVSASKSHNLDARSARDRVRALFPRARWRGDFLGRLDMFT